MTESLITKAIRWITQTFKCKYFGLTPLNFVCLVLPRNTIRAIFPGKVNNFDPKRWALVCDIVTSLAKLMVDNLKGTIFSFLDVKWLTILESSMDRKAPQIKRFTVCFAYVITWNMLLDGAIHCQVSVLLPPLCRLVNTTNWSAVFLLLLKSSLFQVHLGWIKSIIGAFEFLANGPINVLMFIFSCGHPLLHDLRKWTTLNPLKLVTFPIETKLLLEYNAMRFVCTGIRDEHCVSNIHSWPF